MKNKSSRRRRRVRKQQPSQKKQQNENFFEGQVQRKCEKCEDEDKKGVQKKSDGHSGVKVKPFFGSYMKNINTKGSKLSQDNRSFFEGRMNDNFSDVKLHKDKEAANAAKDIGAKAFTWQNHVVVNSDYFEEGSLESKKLLAHELKHVQQQKNGRHQIQMMPEDQSAEPTKEKGVEQMAANDAMAMEKEAELEEDKILTPESVPDFQTFGIPFTKMAYAKSVSFEGTTEGTFDGGVGTTRNLRRAASEGCTGCTENDCFQYTGQLQISYSVSTRVTLPDVPQGLTDCQHERVRSAIDNVLAPHEQDHVAAFNQYNGSARLPINYKGCSAGIADHVQELHDTHAAARRAAAQAASDALDPFHISVDLNCEEEVAPAPTSEEGE